jgi:serine/threonine protein kinase
MSLAAESPARSRHFVKLLARHTCTDFHAIETERLDCTFADLLEVKGVSFAPDLPYYLIDKALEALAYLHDWSDVGIRTFGDFRAKTGLPLRQLIPASVYFRHFRPLAAETLDTLPFQVIHCDLKPSNFLVTIADSARAKLQAGRGEISPDELPEVKLFDFDLCRYSQPDPGSSGSENGPTFMGTCGYTAPELFLVASTGHGIDVRQERRITPLVDFYALGTLFFELLAREPLIPRDRLNVAEKDYYGTVLSYQRSADFAARLELAANPTDRAFIAACTKPVQGERDAALRRLLSIAGPGAPISANALKEWLRSERRTSP